MTYLAHLTHNEHLVRVDAWAALHERLSNFKEVCHLDIEGKLTSLKSKAMTNACSMIHMPINESSDDQLPIVECLHAD